MIEVIRQQRIKAEKKDLWFGLFFFLAGTLVTGVTYYLAISKGGGRYWIAYGAIICGIIFLVKGVINNLRAKNNG